MQFNVLRKWDFFCVFSLHQIYESENFRFPFFYEKKPNLGSEMQKIKLQKIAGNLLVRQASEIVHEWNGHQ